MNPVMTRLQRLGLLRPTPLYAAVSEVAQAVSFPGEAPLSRRRGRGDVRARWALCIVLRRGLDWTYPQIGVAVGGIDHSSVMYAERKAVGLCHTDQVFRARVAAGLDALQAHRLMTEEQMTTARCGLLE